jgi:DUF1707 SHOCT-like domain
MALIGDGERERTARVLRTHYLQGRLTVEELAERLELALRARRTSDVRNALAGLPAAWRDQAAEARAGLDGVKRTAGRIALLVLVWSLWWAVTLVLLIGFVTTVVMNGVSLANAALFAALWLACTLLARHAARQRRPARR